MADLYIRDIPEDIREKYKAAAAARGFSNAEFFVRLVKLHERVRTLLASNREAHPTARGLHELQQIVEELKLTSVTR